MSSEFWETIKASKTVRVELSEYSPKLEGYWIDVVPTSALPPAKNEAISKISDPSEMQRVSMKEWIVDWNLPDKDGKGKLKLPKQSDEWESLVPTDLILFIAKKIREIDEEVMGIPPTSGSPSSLPSGEGAEAQAGSRESS